MIWDESAPFYGVVLELTMILLYNGSRSKALCHRLEDDNYT